MVFVIIILMAVVAGFGIVKIDSIGDEIHAIAEEDLPLLGVLSEITNSQMEQSIWFERALRFGEVLAEKEAAKEGLKNAEEEFKKLAALVDEEIKKGEKIAEDAAKRAKTSEAKKEFEEALEHLKVIAKEHDDIDEQVLQIFALIQQGNVYGAEVLAEKVEKEGDELDHKLDQFVKRIDKFTDEATLKAGQDEEEALRGMLTISGISLVFGIVMGIFITLSITRPLKEAVTINNRLSEGDLGIDIQVNMKRKDEIGQLLISMRHMVEKLSEIVANVQDGATNVASGSEEMSQGASEQATSIEEASSSMEEMAANIKQNADNALETEKIAVEAAENAQKSGKTVADTVSAMQQIAQKITIIEEIARQTHMLSLNATIEAAKAEQYGKGFGVVASEVRALAERSRTAATEINDLASSSVTVAEKAGEMLTKLVPDIQKTAELVQEISAASKEQNSGAGQINQAIQQLDQVIQQNSATSEELAAQAEQLQGAIAFFSINGRGTTRSLLRNTEHAQGAFRTKPATRAKIKVAHIKDHKDVETDKKSGNGTPDGYAIEMAQSGGNGDDLDAEFERY